MIASLKKQLIAMGVILVIVLVGAGIYIHQSQQNKQIVADHSDEIHVHSDFLLVLGGQTFDLSDDRYQSTTYDVKHPAFHLHDGVSTMLHRHAEGITMQEFLESLNFVVSKGCLSTDSGNQYCADDSNKLAFYANNDKVDDWQNYVNQQEDQLLLYHGPKDQEVVWGWLDKVTDESCIYSGTCPERGDPPYESCALTCEI